MLCLFPSHQENPDKKIRSAFKILRSTVSAFGFDPDTMMHIGIPELDDNHLVSYGCAIEFQLKLDTFPEGISQKTLPGGPYTILRIEKKPKVIASSIRQFLGDYIPDNEIIIDHDRPVYEFYYEDTMEYCIPVIE